MGEGVLREVIEYVEYNQRGTIKIPVYMSDSRIGLKKSIRLTVDTGAVSIAVPARALNVNAIQKSIIKSNSTIIQYTGIVSGIPLSYYRYTISEFRVGKNIILKEFPIHITFDDRVNSSLLGMSFLRLFNVYMLQSSRKLVLESLGATKNVVLGRASAKNIENMVIPKIYTMNRLEIDEEVLEANRAYQMIQSELGEHIDTNGK